MVMYYDTDGKTSSKLAFGSALQRSHFLIRLEVTVNCLTLTLKLSKYLQDPTQYLSTAKSYITFIIRRLKSMRCTAYDEFGKMFKSSEKTASQLGAEISLPRMCSRQTQRINVPSNCAEKYYSGSFLPFLDHLISQIDTRFCSDVRKVTPLEGQKKRQQFLYFTIVSGKLDNAHYFSASNNDAITHESLWLALEKTKTYVVCNDSSRFVFQKYLEAGILVDLRHLRYMEIQAFHSIVCNVLYSRTEYITPLGVP